MLLAAAAAAACLLLLPAERSWRLHDVKGIGECGVGLVAPRLFTFASWRHLLDKKCCIRFSLSHAAPALSLLRFANYPPRALPALLYKAHWSWRF
jgi:hypothetical protein